MTRKNQLLKPPCAACSWTIFFAYLGVFAQAVWTIAFITDEARRTEHLKRVTSQMSLIYATESFAALKLGWCAMDGWTCMDVLIHHVPSIVAIFLGVALNLPGQWWLVAWIGCLTSLNEGLFIVISLGAQGWVAKGRRLYGFTIVTMLMLAESYSYIIQMMKYFQAGILGESFYFALATQPALGAIYYHADLSRLYIRRWKRTRTL
jgi:hypothetical protein